MIPVRARSAHPSRGSLSSKVLSKRPATVQLRRELTISASSASDADAAVDDNAPTTSSSQPSKEEAEEAEKNKKKKRPVTVAWVSADNTKRGEVEASVGDNLLEVATRAAAAAGDDEAGGAISAGCYSGSCGLCEVEVNSGAVVRSCVGVVPAGFDVVEVRALSDDAMWNQDAWST